jgi:amino acid adenylation domain-containing protein
MTFMNQNIITPFLRQARKQPSQAALILGGMHYSYGELYERASAVARTIMADRTVPPGLVAVVGNRSITALAGLTGALLAGAGYVPISPAFPPERIRVLLDAADCTSIIAEPGALPALAGALEGDRRIRHVIVPDGTADTSLLARFGAHRITERTELTSGEPCLPPAPGPGSLAYVMFTSGSTGVPKGVMTTHDNVDWVTGVLQDRYRITPADRISLNAEMTFSASVLVIFLALSNGATLCCPTKMELLNPGKFIAENGITVWKCVPSLAALMDRMHQLRPGAFPTIRITTFGGELVPGDLVARWSAAAPGSIIENVYGSTEMSVNTAFYAWDPVRSPGELHRGIVPIGAPLPGVTAVVCDAELAEVAPGDTGELLVSGRLVTAGYLGDPEKTRLAYVTLPGRAGTFFRTGDIVRRPHPGEPMVCLGRRDNQIKVLGNRVELGEIEAIGARVLGTREVAALGWPPSDRGFDGIEVFVGGVAAEETEAYHRLKQHLPPYMVPRRVRLLERLPLNLSGKIDRAALRTILEKEHP